MFESPWKGEMEFCGGEGRDDGNKRDQVGEDGGRGCWERQLEVGGILGMS